MYIYIVLFRDNIDIILELVDPIERFAIVLYDC